MMDKIKKVVVVFWIILVLAFPSIVSHAQEIDPAFAKSVAVKYLSQLMETDLNWRGTEVTNTSIPCFDSDGNLKSFVFEITKGSMKGLIEISADGTGEILRIARTPTPLECALALYHSLGRRQEQLRDDLKYKRVWIVSGENGFYLHCPYLAVEQDVQDPYPLRYQKGNARKLFRTKNLSKEGANLSLPPTFLQLISFLFENIADNAIKNEYENDRKWLLAMSVGPSLVLSGVGLVFLVDTADLAGITPESKDGWVTIYLDFQAYIGVSLWSLIGTVSGISGMVPVFGIIRQEPFPFFYGDEDPDRKEKLEFFEITPFSFMGAFYTNFSFGTKGISLGDEIWFDASIKLINSNIPLLAAEVKREVLLNTCEENFLLSLSNNNIMDPFGLRGMINSVLGFFFCQVGSDWNLCKNIGNRVKTSNDGSINLENGIPKHNLHGHFESKRFYKIEVPPEAIKLNIKTWGGNGNCDLYLKYGSQPSKNDFNFASTGPGNEEEIEIVGNVKPGQWHIMVFGETEYVYTSLMAKYLVLTVPNRPTNLSAVAVSKSQINLSWSDNSGNEDGFIIERKKWASGKFTDIASVGPNSTSYPDRGLESDTTYYYRVRAFNQAGSSPYSNEAHATTFGKVPAPPTHLQATALSASEINLSWQDNSDNEDGFKLERKKGISGTYTHIDTVGADVTFYSDDGLEANTTYYYRLRAYNAYGNSIYSNEASATTSGLVEKDCIALWHFDEGSGKTAYDSSGFNNNASIHGGTTWVKGKAGYALQFDGIDDYLHVPNSPVLNPEEITIALWVKIGSLTWGPGEEPFIIEKSRAFAVGRPQFRIMINREGVGLPPKLFGAIAVNGKDFNVFSEKVLASGDLNKWMFLALTYDKNNLKIFVNGNEEGVNRNPSGPLQKRPEWDLYIGREAEYEHHHFKGVIDEVQIYNRALSPSELKRIYQTKKALREK